MAACVRIKGADTHQPVHPLFAAQIAVGIVARDFKCCGFRARLISVKIIKQCHFESRALAVARIHAVQHLRPVLRLGSASTRVQ
ncbi:hypothetical protein SDC9_165686 [bioreactor metagenome]|uniref:Uncharacterized protein n=1 Tax=bioreactor metagenome TaxID=1076179 RepID=A0A645FWT0_9ZZZZ